MSPKAAISRVLFLCTANSARSQMAEGWLRHLSRGQVAAFSAGTMATRVRPEAITAMAEAGVDIGGQRSKDLEEVADQPFDIVVTVCDAAARTCPRFPGPARRLHWSIPDPVTLDDFRRARDLLRERIEELLDYILPQKANITAPKTHTSDPT